MGNNQRQITLFTSAKTYSGHIDIANESVRTIDIFNSANMFWKDPAEKSFNDALLVHNASIMLAGNIKLAEFAKLQVRIGDILFFHDSLENLGDGMEKRRAAHLMRKTRETTSQVQIITQTRGDAFFSISGMFYGLFKSKSNCRFLPITQAKVVEIIRSNEKWQKRAIAIEGGFVGIATEHIEACTLAESGPAS
jgi:hypothetical protein